MLVATRAALKGQRFEDEEFVAQGDAVFARFNYVLTFPDGSTTSARTMAYYRIADGKIVVNDFMSDPDLMQVLAPILAPLSD
jgi:ketosteroid isomerase-like protein